MSLLVDVMTHTVDQGYADAALRKKAAEDRRRDAAVQRQPIDSEPTPSGGSAAPSGPARFDGPVARPSSPPSSSLWLAVCSPPPRSRRTKGTRRPSATGNAWSSKSSSRQAAADSLQRQADTLNTQITTARDSALATTDRSGALRNQLAELSGVDGAVAVAGSGVRVTLDDAAASGPAAHDGSGIILDSDVRRVVNGLFAAGAEAVAVNGQRLTTQTAIREAGGAILVDYRPLSPPYRSMRSGHRRLGSAFSQRRHRPALHDRTSAVRPGLHRAGPPTAYASCCGHLGRALRQAVGLAVIAALALAVGVVLGVFLHPTVPVGLQPYLPIAVVAALDAVFGGIRAILDGIFDDKVFVVSFIANVLVAALVVFLGDQLGVGSRLATGVVVVLGIRIFSNAAAIRRHLFRA